MKAIVQQANNWLQQHGRLPEGEHVCKLKNDWADGFSVTVDFTRLFNDPDYPEPERAPVLDPEQQAEIKRRGIEEWNKLHPSSSPVN